MPYDYNASLRGIFLLKENQNPDSSSFSTLNNQWYTMESSLCNVVSIVNLENQWKIHLELFIPRTGSGIPIAPPRKPVHHLLYQNNPEILRWKTVNKPSGLDAKYNLEEILFWTLNSLLYNVLLESWSTTWRNLCAFKSGWSSWSLCCVLFWKMKVQYHSSQT